jgi:CRP-like cAMP-binding protein
MHTRSVRKSPWIDRMASIWLFSDCSRAQLRFVDSLCTAAEVGEGKALLQQGTTARQFLVISRGTAVATVDGRPIALIEAGSFAGEMTLFWPGIQRASVTSATHMELLTFSPRECSMLLAGPVPSVREKVVGVLSERREALADHSRESQEATVFEALADLPALHPVGT